MCNSTWGHKIEPPARTRALQPAELRRSHRTFPSLPFLTKNEGPGMCCWKWDNKPKIHSCKQKRQHKSYQRVSFCFSVFITSLKVGFLRCVQLFCREASLHACPVLVFLPKEDCTALRWAPETTAALSQGAMLALLIFPISIHSAILFFIIIVPLQDRGLRQGKVVFSPWIRFTAISVLPSMHVQYSAWGRCLCLHTPLDCRALTPNCRSQNNKD